MALRNVDRVIADNEVAIKDTLRNFETFTASLSGNGEKITSIIATAEIRRRRRRRRADQDQGLPRQPRQRQIWRRIAADRDLDARADRKLRQEIRAIDRRDAKNARRRQRSPSTRPARNLAGRRPGANLLLTTTKKWNARRARQIRKPDRAARNRDPRRERSAAAFAKISLARRFRADGAAPDSEIPLRLHLRRRRDRRRVARQPQSLRRIRLCAARAQRRLRPRPDHDAVRQDLCLAVRHSADGLFGALRLSRRHRADAGGREPRTCR